ncbi:MAG: hypothetical protein HZB41_01780 [Ignavibacteriae bacterium]|nr:hypothetical protein [Ignavibacteriota bacterium]
MKNLTIFLIAFLFTISLYAEKEPILIIYLNNGSSQSYNINEIDNISFNKSEISSLITVFGKSDSFTRYFDVSDINQILFENQQIKFVLNNTIINQNLSEIDSITIKQKEQNFITVSINNDILNLNQLKVSSYADFNRQFDSLGIAKVLISKNGLPQTIMVSDTGNNLIAMGIAKSSDSAIHINGFSSISALVYQNAYMMGMTLEQGADSVVDFIQNLGEVHYVSSFVDDTIYAGKPFMNALDSNLTAILKGAFIKTYEYATGDTISFTNKVKGKNKLDNILNEKISIYPSEYQSGINLTAEKDNNEIIICTVKNKIRRHINIRWSVEGSKITPLGPSAPIFNKILSFIWDRKCNKDTTTEIKEDYTAVHTLGMSTYLGDKNAYPDKDNKDFRLEGLKRTNFSIWLAVFETYITTFVPVLAKSDINTFTVSPEQIQDIIELYNVFVTFGLKIPDIYYSFNDKNLKDFLLKSSILILDNIDLVLKIIKDFGGEATKDAIAARIPGFSLIAQTFSIGILGCNLWFVDEYNIFNLIPTNSDIIKPTIEILSPSIRKQQANSVIPIGVKFSDNDKVQAVHLYIGFSKTPIQTFQVNPPSNEGYHTFDWDNKGYLGYVDLYIRAEDVSGNVGSALLKLDISNNPNDKTKPTISILEPTSNKVPVNSIIPITIRATDDNSLLQVSCFIDNKKMLWAEKFENIFLKDTTFRFNWITCNLPIGSKHNINVFAVDGNYNTTSLGYEVEIIQSDDNISLCGLTSFYPFNGNANDEGGNGNHGTVYGASLTTDRFGNPNRAYSFNGISNDIKLTGKFGGGREMSVSAWFNVNDYTGDFQGIFESEGGYTDMDGNIHLQCNDGGNNVVYYNTGHCLLPILSPTPFNQWRHVAITAKSGEIRLYENGELKGECNDTYEFISESNKIKIGSGVNGRFFRGMLDDIRVYNRALTEAEVQVLSNDK